MGPGWALWGRRGGRRASAADSDASEGRRRGVSGGGAWGAPASGAGVATWDGTNRFGRAAASGTYLAVVKSNGTQRLRRVVLIR